MNSAMINGFSDELQQIHKHAAAAPMGAASAVNTFARRSHALSKAVPGEAVKTLEASRAAAATAAASAAKRQAADEAAQRLGKGSLRPELSGLNLPQFAPISRPAFMQ